MTPIYSDWLRIDLHIHTDFSRKTKEGDYQGHFSVSVLKEKLISNRVQVFSMTDHNIINTEAYKEYYDSYDPAVDPLLLLGVELDIEVINPKGSKTYHSLLIFNYSTIASAQELSARLEKKYKEKGIPDKERKLSISEVVELFPNDDFFFIPHAGNTKSIVDAHKHDIRDCQQMVLLMQSAFEKVPEKNVQRYNEGFDQTLYKAFQNKNDHAYIEFSDNHCVEKYPCTNKGQDNVMHQFYYVKGGKNFETLRLAFIDPESRIKSESELVNIQKLPNYIERIKINEMDLLAETEILLSPHLNVLIGGRSSGKSLMMSILGEKIDGVSMDDKRYSKVNYGEIQIKSKLDANYLSSTPFTKEEIIFIKQGDIVRYFEENILEELAKEANKHAEYQDAKSQFKTQKVLLDFVVNSLITAYDEARESDITQKTILHDIVIDRMLNKNYIFKVDFESLKLESDSRNELAEANSVLDNLKTNSELLRKNALFSLTEEDIQVLDQFSALLGQKTILINTKGEIMTKKFSFFDEIIVLIQNKNQLLNSEAQGKVEALAQYRKMIDSVGLKFQKLKNLKNASEKFSLFDYALRTSIEISERVQLVLEVERAERLDNLLLESLNGGDVNSTLYNNLLDLLRGDKTIKNYGGNKTNDFKRKIAKQLEEIIASYSNPKDYLDYGEGNTSRNNSPGFNSEKYLEIIMRNPQTKLILIDQPEDNLGNRFIADNLVKLIRDIKFHKQVILVTHNPSVVVYGDAELVIVAENNENKISYKQIVIENEDSQKEICKILDGGEYIFNMRARKYNIKKILNKA